MNETIKNFWATQEIIERGYKIKITRKYGNATVEIKTNGSTDAKFEIIHYEYKDFDLEGYSVYDGFDEITEYLDFTDTLDECINGCIYYYYTRY